jgi:hypothetical protein
MASSPRPFDRALATTVPRLIRAIYASYERCTRNRTGALDLAGVWLFALAGMAASASAHIKSAARQRACCSQYRPHYTEI